MTKDYSGNLATVKRLIRNAGRQITLIQLENVSSDPLKPWDESTADPRTSPEDSSTTFAVAVPPSGITSLGFSASQVDLLKDIGQIFIVEPGETDATEFEKYNILQDGGKDYRIAFIEKLQPGDTVLLYYIGVAR